MTLHRVSTHIIAFSTAVLLSGAALFAQSSNSGQSMNPRQTSNSEQMTHSEQSMHSGQAEQSGQASAADKRFAHKAMEGGMAEVKLGQLAAENAGSEDIKAFGQKMVEDHSKLNDQMKPIAEQIGVNPPSELSAKDEDLYKKLQGETGSNFDKTYIRAMLKDHRNDLREFHEEAREGQDPALKQAAASGAQVIQQHLDELEHLAQKHDVTSEPMSSAPAK